MIYYLFIKYQFYISIEKYLKYMIVSGHRYLYMFVESCVDYSSNGLPTKLEKMNFDEEVQHIHVRLGYRRE